MGFLSTNKVPTDAGLMSDVGYDFEKECEKDCSECDDYDCQFWGCEDE